MGSAAPKPRPMRSRRSGRKKSKLMKANHEILKKIEQEIKEDKKK